MKKQRRPEKETRPPRNIMEARALGYTEERHSDECEDFLTPNKMILTGYVDLTYSHDMNPPLRVPFTARYSYGRPELDRPKADRRTLLKEKSAKTAKEGE